MTATDGKYTILADSWDFQASERSFRQSPELHAAQKRMAEKSTGAEIFRDLFHSLIKAVPVLHKKDEIDTKFHINHTVMKEMMEIEEFETMRKMSVGDTVGTAIACAALEPKLQILFDKLKQLQDIADELAKKEQELAEARGDKSAEDLIKDLTDEIEELSEQLEDGLDEAGAGIRESMEDAMKELADQAEGEQIARSWGLGSGELARMGHKERIALAKKLSTPEFKRMADVIGKFQNIAMSNIEETQANIYEEIYDVEQGNDFSRFLGGEMAAFGHDILFFEQAKKYLERSVSQYAIEGKETMNKGSIIYCCDGSPSMHGDRQVWAKAIGLALLKVAEFQGRDFVAIQFGGPGCTLRMEYDNSGSEVSVTVTENASKKPLMTKTGFDAILQFAELGYLGGGTDYVTPLDMAIQVMEDEKERTGRITADIVFATDDECNVPSAWETKYNKKREELDFKVYSFVIGVAHVSTMNRLSDIVLSPKQLLDGTDLAEVFRRL